MDFKRQGFDSEPNDSAASRPTSRRYANFECGNGEKSKAVATTVIRRRLPLLLPQPRRRLRLPLLQRSQRLRNQFQLQRRLRST